MPKQVDFNRPRYLPPLWFDTSGSASARFVGKPAMIGVHWADAKVQQLKLVCPKSIKPESSCEYCSNNPDPASPRFAVIAYDIASNQWSVYMGHSLVFQEIFVKVQAHGVDQPMMESGAGPDILMQRIGKRTEIMVVPESIGTPRWQGQSPCFESVLDYMAERSHWKRFKTAAELAEMYPKNATVDAPPVTEFNPAAGAEPIRGFVDGHGPISQFTSPEGSFIRALRESWSETPTPPPTPSQSWVKGKILPKEAPKLKPIDDVEIKPDQLLSKDDWDFLS